MHKVLIVDDEPLLLQGLGQALQSGDTTVTMAETGEAALAAIASSSCHLCFLDVFLPDIDGVELLHKIKALSPSTKVVVMTAGILNQQVKENIEKNAYMFITKPFDLLQIKMLTRRISEWNCCSEPWDYLQTTK